MSRADNCYDNSFMESFIGTFKTELEMTEYEDSREARREAAEYIRYYNFERNTPPWSTSHQPGSNSSFTTRNKRMTCP